MKNFFSAVKNKIISRYLLNNESLYQTKKTDINVLLNRVKLDQKNENRKKILFTAATSVGVVIFGILIF